MHVIIRTLNSEVFEITEACHQRNILWTNYIFRPVGTRSTAPLPTLLKADSENRDQTWKIVRDLLELNHEKYHVYSHMEGDVFLHVCIPTQLS